MGRKLSFGAKKEIWMFRGSVPRTTSIRSRRSVNEQRERERERWFGLIIALLLKISRGLYSWFVSLACLCECYWSLPCFILCRIPLSWLYWITIDNVTSSVLHYLMVSAFASSWLFCKFLTILLQGVFCYARGEEYQNVQAVLIYNHRKP